LHSVLWALALHTYAGFLGVSETLRMAGRNYGLKGMGFVLFILIPAALPSILAGLKIGWAFAWRTLIAAQLVFGATSGKGGLVDHHRLADRVEAAHALPGHGGCHRAGDQHALHDRLEPEVQLEGRSLGDAEHVDAEVGRCRNRSGERSHRPRSTSQLARVQHEG
jgi:hypothetical protein